MNSFGNKGDDNLPKTPDEFPIKTLPEGYAALMGITRQDPKPTIREIFEQMDQFAYARRIPEALMGNFWYEEFPSHLPEGLKVRPVIFDKAFRAAWVPFLIDQTARGYISYEQCLGLIQDTVGYIDHQCDPKYSELIQLYIKQKIEEIGIES